MFDFPVPLNRPIAPKYSAANAVTYAMKMPIQTHFRSATCEEAHCTNRLNGFKVHVERIISIYGPEQGSGIVHLMKTSGKKFLELRVAEGQTWLEFEAGQDCFDGDQGRHVISLERPPTLYVHDGDYRGNPRGTQARVHTSLESWTDDLRSHTDTLHTAIQKG
jgi:hypothetical protein